MERIGLIDKPDRCPALEECDFYHVVDLGHTITHGQWDLRGKVDEYLGNYSFRNKRVLELGPASGFLTFEMEKRGADVLAVEVTDEHGWDFVPYPDVSAPSFLEPRAAHMNRIKNSFWHVHAAKRSNAKVYYGDVGQLPKELGRFDVAIAAAVLLHCRSPLQVIEQCVARSDAIIIVDQFHRDLEGKRICRLQPTSENKRYDTWWNFGSDFLCEWLGVLGLKIDSRTVHSQLYAYNADNPVRIDFFTIIGSR